MALDSSILLLLRRAIGRGALQLRNCPDMLTCLLNVRKAPTHSVRGVEQGCKGSWYVNMMVCTG